MVNLNKNIKFQIKINKNFMFLFQNWLVNR